MEDVMSNPSPSRAFAPGSGAVAVNGQSEVIQVPNMLRLKVGSRFGGLNAGAVAKAEAALKNLSSQFSQWLRDELDKLEAARAAIREQGLTKETGDRLYTHAHDLKGLGGTYEFPIITRMAGSLCKLIETPDQRLTAPMKLVDAHIDAIRAAVRDDIRDDANPMGRVLAQELERQVAAYITADKGSAIRP
jgi:chemotaxis protein histidine kinase CheA